MHKTTSFLRLVCLILIVSLLLGREALAASAVLGATCSTVGMSQMTDDQKNLAVCLKNDSDVPVWKSMTSGGQFKITNYSATGSSNVVRNIGAHKFCALATEGESGGCGRCSVYLSQGSYIMDSASCSGSSYTWCDVTCMD